MILYLEFPLLYREVSTGKAPTDHTMFLGAWILVAVSNGVATLICSPELGDRPRRQGS